MARTEPRLTIDSLIEGKAGSTSRIVTGRVYSLKETFVGLIGENDGQQWIVYRDNITVLDGPRPLAARNNIPARLR